MRNLTGVSIERIIVHVLDCRKIPDEEKKEKSILSDVSIDIQGRSFLLDYFQNQIINVSLDEDAGLAVLSDEYDQEITPIYNQIIFKPDKFVSASKDLGRRLHRIMDNDKRIVPGVLAVCVFNSDSIKAGPLLALLKLDITPIFIHHVTEDEKGHHIVTLQLIPDALPTARERLQKAALIRRLENPGWEMLVLDRQVGEREMRPAAEFFLEFLGAEWKLTSKALTLRFFGTMMGVASKLYKSKDEKNWGIADSIFQAQDVALSGKEINPKKIVDNLSVSIDLKKKLKTELKNTQVQQKFVVHRPTADKLTNKLRFRGDNDLVLAASSSAYDGMVSEGTTEKDGVTYKHICITTRRWQRLKPRGK